MNRSEKRKRYLIILLVFSMLTLPIPLAMLRVTLESGLVTGNDIRRALTDKGTVTDRTGGLLYDGKCLDDATAGNLVGGTGMNLNTLVESYSYALARGRAGVLFPGVNGFENSPGRQLRTTLLGSQAREEITRAFRGKNGCCFSYNYVTGEVYTMLSYPSSSRRPEEDDGSGSLINRCLSTQYTPGSVMKILTAICALEQNPALLDFRISCEQRTEVNGHNFVCAYQHGDVGFPDALGKSCNAYFAALINSLDAAQAQETLRKMGLSVNEAAPKKALGKQSRVGTKIAFTGDGTPQDTWGLIGQGDTLASVIDMAMIAGAAANRGKAHEPVLALSVVNSRTGGEKALSTGKEKRLFSEKAAQILESEWAKAMKTYYRTGAHPCVEAITYAKTGTPELHGKSENKTLLGVCKDSQTAFFIVVEDYRDGDPTPIDIANTLAKHLPPAA